MSQAHCSTKTLDIDGHSQLIIQNPITMANRAMSTKNQRVWPPCIDLDRNRVTLLAEEEYLVVMLSSPDLGVCAPARPNNGVGYRST